MTLPNSDPTPSFKEVTMVPLIIGGAQRLAMLCTIEISGRTSFTMSPSEALDQLATDEAIPLNEYMTTFGVDVDKSLISVSVVKIGTANAVAVRHTKKLVTVHAGGVFEEYPQLRPAGRRQCVITSGTNAKGKPCLVIALNTAVVKRRTPRGSANTDNPAPAQTSNNQVAAAKATAAKETAAKETAPGEAGQ